MKKSNIEFENMNNTLSLNKTEINFNDEIEEIPVDEETIKTICIGNFKTNKLKSSIQCN